MTSDVQRLPRSKLPALGLIPLALATLLCACGQAAPAGPSAGSGSTPSGGTVSQTSAAAGEWEQIVAGGQREGQVVVRGPAGTDINTALTADFRKKYPQIEIDYTGGRGTELIPKVVAETSAGKYTADVLITGTVDVISSLMPAGAVDPIRPFLVGPSVQDLSKWMGGKLDFADEGAQYNLVYTGTVKVPLAYNTSMVSPGDVKSYKDLLEPKWKGKVVMLDPRQGGPGQSMATFFYISQDLGKEYLRQLFASGIVLTKDDHQQLDWVARGQYPIALSPNEGLAPELMKSGVPLGLLGAEALKEGSYLTAGSGSLSIAKKAPHPNAAKVYLDWLLSKEGQTNWANASGFPSRRLDVPRDQLLPASVPKDGVQYLETYKDPYVRMKEEVAAFLATTIRD